MRDRPRPVPAAQHNRVLRAAEKRADDLTARLERVLHPILDAAGTDAARRFEEKVVDHMTASGSALVLSQSFAAAGEVSGTSTMLALVPRPEEAAALTEVGGHEAERLHVTVAFLGETEGPLTAVRDALLAVAATHAPLEGQVGGVGIFGDNGDGHPAIALPSVPGLVELRVDATEALTDAGIEYGRNWGYQPHMTIAYRETPSTPDVAKVGQELHFDSLWIVRGDVERVEIPLTGGRPLTAAGEPTPWTPPAPNELIDVDALVATLRTKTDPVRRAVIETVMKTVVEGVGEDWDVTNPFIGKALETTGSQITNIAETTQVNVMRIIRAAYEQGLSIPDTATAIRSGMKEASGVRATLIARTEMVGATNVASLEATKLVAGVTGVGYQKSWMTAPGAPNPRHELYEGLDGQTVGLEEEFDVGGSALQYPGDPNGPPEEVCNCRCTMSYLDPAGDETGDAVEAEEG